ncbi:MAG: gamma-glutamyl-gamma-aminobutyrate hydrolase family protein [Thermodesulfobacteriota bacterium]|nr:gamma-glutamyl-gamma-aminobutyrate hydrolase family protein [Thermodesulfobacteriota bacterium]
MRPVVGIPCYSQERQNDLFREASATQQSYLRALEQAGVASVLIPVSSTMEMIKDILERIDGLVLVGGRDIDPKRYGETPLPKLSPTDEKRDDLELNITSLCFSAHIPILGICRGIQTLNVCAGGSLWQDIATQVSNTIKHDYYPNYPRNKISHSVQIEKDSRLSEIFSNLTLNVNSLHHQGIKKIGEGFRVTALSTDGIIEGIEWIGESWIVGVQWHPEELINDDLHMKSLFEAFASACNDYLTGKNT